MFPVYLSINQFYVYGNNLSENVGWLGYSGERVPGHAFTTIYKIWDGGNVIHQEGDNVMVKDEPVCRLAWDNGQYSIYTLDKIVITENTEDAPLP